MKRPRILRLAGTWSSTLVLVAVLAAGALQAAEKGSEQVSSFYGTLGYSVPFDVPSFHGLEPRIALAYNSEGRNGTVGVGWSLTGFSTVERVNAGRGTPRFDSSDVYVLDGQELMACGPTTASPSCATGGSHTAKIESYLRIFFDAGANTWTAWEKDGTQTVLEPIVTTPLGTHRWGIARRVDTLGNRVDYTWDCLDGQCYSSTISYNGYGLTVYRELRPDVFSAGDVTSIAQTRYRVRSVLVHLGSAPIRAYKLSYTQSPLTGRSLLASVQQYGRDVAIDGQGAITGGSSLPPVGFVYQGDTIGKGFHSMAADPTPPGTVRPVTWTSLNNSIATGAALNSLYKTVDGFAFNASGTSIEAIASGDGYVEWTARTGDGYQVVGLSSHITGPGFEDMDFAVGEWHEYLVLFESGAYLGAFGVANGDKLRIEVQGGVVRYKRNGATFYTSTKAPVYPLRVDASIANYATTIQDAFVAGALQNAAHWCVNAIPTTADLNADGRADQVCYTGAAQGMRVSLATPTGFLPPTNWLPNTSLNPWTLGDFNGDGKLDIADFSSWEGWFRVALSTGTSFSAPVFWGEASGTAPDNFAYACRNVGGSPTNIGTGDFNGDGRTDVWCKVHGGSEVFVGISTGSSFSFSIWAQLASDFYERVGPLDFDGDGKDDWYVILGGNLFVNRSTGGSFVDGYYGSASVAMCDQSYVFGDFNGDGRTDVVCRANGNIALSTGRSFATSGSVGAWCGSSTDVFAADVDGDGASELVCSNGPVLVRKWTGSGFGPAETWKQAWCPVGALGAGDFNGDTKMDLFCRTLGAPVAYAGTGALKSDLLSGVTSPLGGTLEVGYMLSTASSANGPPPKYVVASLATGDGRGAISTRTFSYSGAYMNHLERRFIGFRQVRETRPCVAGEVACPTVDTWLRQDLPSAGKPERVEERDGAGRLLRATVLDYDVNAAPPFTSLLSAEWAYTYDGSGTECTTWPCPSAKRTRTDHQYDTLGNRVQTVSHGDHDEPGDEVTTTWAFQPNGSAYITDRVAAQRRFAGLGTSGLKVSEKLFRYDGSGSWSQPPSHGLMTAVLDWLNTEDRHVATRMAYDTVGNLTSTIDPTGRVTMVSYDTLSRISPVSIRNPAGEIQSVAWDPVCGVPQQRTDANGQVVAIQTDALCRPFLTEGPLGRFVAPTYQDLGDPAVQRLEIRTPSAVPGSAPDYAIEYLDGLGRTYRRVRRGPAPGQDIVEDTTYDARGRIASETAPHYQADAPQTTTHEYDAVDRLVRTTHPDGTSILKSHGVWSETTRDEHGHPVTERRDAYGRVVRKEAQLANQPVPTEYRYDALGRLVGMTDALGNAWAWTLDSLGRTISRSDPDSGTWTFEFDDAGRETAHTDAKAQRTETTYDAGGRLATRTNADGTVTYTYSEPRPGYFNAGRLTTVQSLADRFRGDYDELGRAVRTERILDNTSFVLQHRYDPGGRTLGLTYPDGDAVGTPDAPFRYDLAGRLLAVPGIVNEVLYDASGRPVRQANANGTVTTRTYAPDRGFLTRVTTAGAAPIQDLAYSSDPAGLVTQVASAVAGEGWAYAYDDLHRLASAENLSNPADTQTYQYDEIGRIVFNSRLGTYSYPPVGQPRPHAPLEVAGSAYEYDVNGNLIAGGGRSLSWNADNRLVQANTSQFTYDAAGTRLKTVSPGTTSVYPLGDDYEVTNGVVTKYVSLPGLGVVAKRVGGATHWLHADRLGSIQAVTSTSGTAVFRRKYRPYGDTLSESGSHTESRGYIDQRRDDETRAIYLHARYYDPALAVFLSPDPTHPVGRGVGPHRYGYASGNPVNATDRTGLWWVPFFPCFTTECVDVIGDLPFTPIDWPDPGSAWPSDDPQPYTPPEPNPAPSPSPSPSTSPAPNPSPSPSPTAPPTEPPPTKPRQGGGGWVGLIVRFAQIVEELSKTLPIVLDRNSSITGPWRKNGWCEHNRQAFDNFCALTGAAERPDDPNFAVCSKTWQELCGPW